MADPGILADRMPEARAAFARSPRALFAHRIRRGAARLLRLVRMAVRGHSALGRCHHDVGSVHLRSAISVMARAFLQ